MKTDWAVYEVPEKYRERPFDTYPDKERAVEFVKHFVEGKESHWCLYLHGEPGCGKTHLAVAALKYYIIKNRYSTALFLTCRSYFSMLQDNFNNPLGMSNLTRKLLECDLIILDDLGVSRGTDWQREKICELIEERYNKNKKTIISTNWDLEKAKQELLDDRLYRRIAEGKVLKIVKSKYHGNENKLFENE